MDGLHLLVNKLRAIGAAEAPGGPDFISLMIDPPEPASALLPFIITYSIMLSLLTMD